MARILAIDYGSKRVGLAVTDDTKLFATALDTLHSKDVIAFLKKYVETNAVETFLVGEPKTLDNLPSDSAEQINNFTKHLAKTFPTIQIKRIDERFTSAMALQAMIAMGTSKKQRQEKQGNIDKISATLMLQNYLQTLENL